MTARAKILQRLALAGEPLPLHKLNLEGVSQTAASARLRELHKDGLVISVPVQGKRFTAWMLTPESDYQFDLKGSYNQPEAH
jgi:DNA-binding HxlR family transcriptional regulator